MFNYREFVTELRPLIHQGRRLKDLEGLHNDRQFREWRHKVTDLIERVEQLGYDVNSSIREKSFDQHGSYTYDPTRADRLAAYNRDLEDTLTELATIVDHFDKFGDPRAEQRSGPSPLRVPERITAAWVWKNAAMSVWFWFVGLLLAAFLFGVTVGQSSTEPLLQN
jgi:hypothetical protein